MTTAQTRYDLSALTRPSGGFAMLAVDQREALRLMFAGAAPLDDGTVPPEVRRQVPDQVLTDFKVAATEILTPHASGVLVDRQFAFDAVVGANAVAPECGLISSADHFVPGSGEPVADVEIDTGAVPERVREQGAVAMKLLVVHRPDGSPERRRALVAEFAERCRRAGLVSIVEPVSRKPLSGGAWNPQVWQQGVRDAAAELGTLGADLYKAEVPLRGQGTDDEVRRHCAELNSLIASPWVVLSSGVPADEFPRAVELACAEGASGFLAGRAVWSACVGADDVRAALREDAVPRLQRLGGIVDAAMADRS
ncbi:aldolase [Streptomonospora sediminis]